MIEVGDIFVNMGIVFIWLYYKDNFERKIRVYVIFDNVSGGIFIKEESLEKFGVKGIEIKLLLIIMYGI